MPSACEVCAAPLSETDCLLCPQCSRAFTIVLELLREPSPVPQNWLEMHSELTSEDLDRVGRVLKWRSRKIGLESAEFEIPVTSHS